MSILVYFFDPYMRFLLGAAYNIQQTLEGFRISSSSFIVRDSTGSIVQSYLSPLEAAMFPFGILLLYSLILVVLVTVTSFILARKKGIVMALLILASPGVASTLRLWPSINYLPDSFEIDGTGILGSAWGVFPLLMIGLLTGWSLIIILSDTFDLKDKFRYYYDHLWYSTAVLAGTFFVSDSGTYETSRELQQANQSARQASLYFLQQVKAYDLHCKIAQFTATASCVWASDVQQILNDYATRNERVFPTGGLKSSAEIYNPLRREFSPKRILKIRSELKAYNDLRCPMKEIGHGIRQFSRSSATCQRPPAIFCTSFPDPLNGRVDKENIGRTVAIASECIVPSLVASRAKQERLGSVVAENSRKKHYRWLFFILFSVVVGGKVANATSRAMEFDKRPERERRRSVRLLKSLWFGAKIGIMLPFNFWVLGLVSVSNHWSNNA